jgi:serine/threonine protein phosphatase 1
MKNNKRTIIIGDLHGMCHEAHKLLEKCQATANDRVIFLGDLVDRGSDSASCVDLALELEARQNAPSCILGNHEEKHIFYDDVQRRKGKVDVHVETHVETRRQLKSHHYDYFRTLPKFIRLPEYNAVCVHAGVWPGRSIEEQSDRHLLHVQMIRPYPAHGAVSEKSLWASKVPTDEEGWKFWTQFWNGPERIIFGHSVLTKPLVTDYAIGLDGGACFGLELWALVLPSWEIVRLKCESKHGDRGDRKVTLIHENIGTY